MSSRLILAIGVIAQSQSKFITNAPYNINSWVLGENNETTLLGMLSEKQMPYDAIDVANIDKVKLLGDFDVFKETLKTSTLAEEFGSEKKKQAWFEELEKLPVRIVVLLTE